MKGRYYCPAVSTYLIYEGIVNFDSFIFIFNLVENYYDFPHYGFCILTDFFEYVPLIYFNISNLTIIIQNITVSCV